MKKVRPLGWQLRRNYLRNGNKREAKLVLNCMRCSDPMIGPVLTYKYKNSTKLCPSTVKTTWLGISISLQRRNTESRKNLEQKFIFQLGTLYPHGINESLSFH